MMMMMMVMVMMMMMMMITYMHECIQGVRSVRQQSRLLRLVRRSLSPD